MVAESADSDAAGEADHAARSMQKTPSIEDRQFVTRRKRGK